MFARDYRRLARDNLENRWAQAVGAALVAGFLGGSVSIGSGVNISVNIDLEDLVELSTELWAFLLAFAGAASIIGTAQFVIGGAIQLGYCKYLLKQHDRTEPKIGDLFTEFNRLGEGLCLRILMALFVLLWSLLFIIPGIVASYSYSMAPYIMAEDPGCSPREAIRRSKELMQGHKGELFCLELSFIGWVFLCIFTCGIGFLFLQPYTDAAWTAFYRNLCPNEQVQYPNDYPNA